MSEVDKLRAEIEWHKENSAKWQDTQAAHLREIIGRQAHDRMQVREIKHLTAEVEKLRAALEEIIQDSFSVYAIQVARAALEGKQ